MLGDIVLQGGQVLTVLFQREPGPSISPPPYWDITEIRFLGAFLGAGGGFYRHAHRADADSDPRRIFDADHHSGQCFFI
ncbi:hypothetical protein [Acidithiobacillus ferriphilus]|uniref:hypothetical protein n=1 Tax=Acidithiobacillus ferriphilus TaxID=1689834 RepID=UPI00232CAC00|nr:hypothetical protein [Acidithiobacillus ferriphilus]WCE94118.1 hypothetical protein PJU76_00835 [Acidithiobacillus ferriphilus]